MTLVAGVLTDTRPASPPARRIRASSPCRRAARARNTTNYILDGGSNNDHYSNAPNPMPNPDALQEFSVQTNSFSAEYGRNVGAIVNAVTRSGTNQFHGLGFGYLRHHELNATNFFTPGVDDGLKRYQYGGTLGGPIVQNRTFFFGSYQGTNQKSQPPDRAAPWCRRRRMRSGDFSSLSRASCATRSPASRSPSNQIPSSALQPGRAGDPPRLAAAAQPGRGRQPADAALLGAESTATITSTSAASITASATPTVSTAAPGCRARRCRPYLEQGNAINSSFGRTWQNTIVSVNDTYVISPTC